MQSIRSYRELATWAWRALEAAANEQDHCLVAANGVPLYAAVRLNGQQWEVTGRWPVRQGVWALELDGAVVVELPDDTPVELPR